MACVMYSPSIVKSRPDATFTVNALVDVAVPPAVVTLIAPLVAPFGTVAEMWPASVTEKVAVVPLNFTPVAPVKFVPVIVTFVPDCPLVGEKLVIVGAAALTVKLPADVAFPCGVTIEILPVTAALGTVAITFVALTTEKIVAATPPIETEVAPFKFVPVTDIEVPTAPLVGLKLVMVGVFAGCGVGGVVVTAPPPHPASNAVSARILLQRERTVPRGRILPASRSRSPNNMAPFLLAQGSAGAEMFAASHTYCSMRRGLPYAAL